MTPRLYTLLQWIALAVAVLLPTGREVTVSNQVRFEAMRGHAPDGVELGESLEAEEVDGEEAPSEDERSDDLSGTPPKRPGLHHVHASIYCAHAPRGPPSHVTTCPTRAHPVRGPPVC